MSYSIEQLKDIKANSARTKYCPFHDDEGIDVCNCENPQLIAAAPALCDQLIKYLEWKGIFDKEYARVRAMVIDEARASEREEICREIKHKFYGVSGIQATTAGKILDLIRSRDDEKV